MNKLIKEWDEWTEDESDEESNNTKRYGGYSFDRLRRFKDWNDKYDGRNNIDHNTFCYIKFIGAKRFNDIIQYLGEVEEPNGIAELHVTQEDIDDTGSLFDGLLGWDFKRIRNGIHLRDGTMVDYRIIVINNKDIKVADFHFNMRLNVGWDIRF